MNAKTAAAVSYATIIGWLISYLATTDGRGSLVRYHMKQSFGIMLLSVLLSIIIGIIAVFMPAIAGVLLLTCLVIPALGIAGILNALKEKQVPVPVVGKIFESAFGFIQ